MPGLWGLDDWGHWQYTVYGAMHENLVADAEADIELGVWSPALRVRC